MRRAVWALCAAEVLTMVPVFAFPALLPDFIAQWSLSNTDAGWISGVGFAGYAAAVPVLTALTDRIDAKRIYVAGALLAGLSALAFPLLAEGFWSALALRALGGAGLAGTYMPGLRALVDRTAGPWQPRWMSFYTAGFSLGTSASFLLSGAIGQHGGWQAAFVLGGLAAMGGAALVALALRPHPPVISPDPSALLDFRPVFANRAAMAYVLGYAAHMWELFGLRSWMVAFLAFSLSLQPDAWGPSPTAAATLGALLAMLASVGGADLAARFDRARVCMVAMILSGVMACGLGFAAALPYGIVVGLVLLYNGLVQIDSAALTTGAVLAAHEGRRGATIAVHSLLGFAAAFLGPLAFGLVLDFSGWGLAFASLGAVVLLGPLALHASAKSARPSP